MKIELNKPKLEKGFITYYANVKGKEEYGICIRITTNGILNDKSNCTCKYGSYHRYTKKNKDYAWICRHILNTYAKIIKESPFKTKQKLIKEGILDKNHLK